MIFHKTTGGGASLNFNVVKNPIPENPAVNTIWVNTDTDIDEWFFSPNAPELLNEGDVWFESGSFGDIEINALKKNGIYIYPLSAKQQLGGELVDKDASIFIDGEWVPLSVWNGELYDAGREFISVTGGWQGRALTYDVSNSAYAALEPEVTKYDDHIHVAYNNPTKVPGGGLEIAKDVDLTGWSKIKSDIGFNLANGWLYLAVIDRSATQYSGKYAASVTVHVDTKNGRNQNVTLDISKLSGYYDIMLYFRGANPKEVWTADLYYAKLEV